MRFWLKRHPILAILGLVFIGLSIAVALAVIASSSQTVAPADNRRRPTIAGASPAIAGAAEVTIASAPDENQLGKLPLFFFQALIVVFGIAASVYVTMMVTGKL